MTAQDKLTRMDFIVENSKTFMPHVPSEVKRECIDLIQENISQCKEVSLRSLEKVINVCVGAQDDFEYDDTDGLVTTEWRTLARYMLIN